MMNSGRNQYYASLIDERLSDFLFIEDEDLSAVTTSLKEKKYKIIDMREFELENSSVYQEKLIEISGYPDNGAGNPNVFYELISDLRWLEGDLLAVIIGNSEFIFRPSFTLTLNSMTEGSARLRIEQDRHLLKLVILGAATGK